MGYLTANDRPGAHAASWYAATAGPVPEHPPLAGETRADVCVVGGGYAGLSAALHLAERGYDVVLLEANRVGWGASGRNGGQVGVGPRADMDAYERLAGREDARKIWEMGLEANRLVRTLVARHGIDCDLAGEGLEVAWRAGETAEFANYDRAHGHRLWLRPDRAARPRRGGGAPGHHALPWRGDLARRRASAPAALRPRPRRGRGPRRRPASTSKPLSAQQNPAG